MLLPCEVTANSPRTYWKTNNFFVQGLSGGGGFPTFTRGYLACEEGKDRGAGLRKCFLCVPRPSSLFEKQFKMLPRTKSPDHWAISFLARSRESAPIMTIHQQTDMEMVKIRDAAGERETDMIYFFSSVRGSQAVVDHRP